MRKSKPLCLTRISREQIVRRANFTLTTPILAGVLIKIGELEKEGFGPVSRLRE